VNECKPLDRGPVRPATKVAVAADEAGELCGAPMRALRWVHTTVVSTLLIGAVMAPVMLLKCTECGEAMRKHVQVDTDEVLQRLQAAFVPWHSGAPGTIQGIHRRPDLKGPLACALTARPWSVTPCDTPRRPVTPCEALSSTLK
jgi:hypothetical protein